MEKYTHRRLTVSEYRHFGFSFGVGMLLLTLIGWWRHFPFPLVMVTLGLSLYHWVVGLLWPRSLWVSEMVVSGVWYGVSQMISRLVLGVLFYGILTPLFWLLRLFGQDHIAKNRGEWQDFSSSENDPKKMERWF
ncbi:MAG: hypothetical protein N2314_01395 [Brevinematales bacterium]|nr:hypothetical protein [Brevinematales bacterium]